MEKHFVKKIAVTGINGFVGKHLARELNSQDIYVVGLGREDTVDPEIAELVGSYISVDLTTEWPDGTSNVDAIIHLAGLAAVGPSFDEPQKYLNLNSAMVTHMAEYYLKQEKKPRILVVSSGAIYDPDQSMPLTEGSAIGFTSPYSVSKVLVENQCAYYRKRGLDCIIARPFNHIGPGQLPGFLVPDVIAQLRTGETITVGDITTKRDYTDVRDVARAYRLLSCADELRHEIYNVCSGRSISGGSLIAQIKTAMGKDSAATVIDQARVRPTDASDIYGNADSLREDTGWEPTIVIEQTIRDCVA